MLDVFTVFNITKANISLIQHKTIDVQGIKVSFDITVSSFAIMHV